MSFKENLLKKITIDQLARKAARSLAPRDGISGIDTDSMKLLLDFSPYEYRQERDLDLYVHPAGSAKKHILVLDNGLPFYHTTIEDVLIRKSPTIKEMLSIKNAIRILSDSDVLVSKKTASIERVHRKCVERLDLSFAPSDVERLAKEGEIALAIKDSKGVRETLSLFAELLGYTPAPEAYFAENIYMICNRATTEKGHESVNTMVTYHLTQCILKLIDNLSHVPPAERIEYIENMIAGKSKPSAEGADVFGFLKQQVLEQMPAITDRLC